MALSKGFELATLGSGLDVNQSTGEVVTISMDTDVVSEGSSNLYFTNERVDDRVADLLVGGSNITVTYDDTAGTLTIAGQSRYSDSDVNAFLAGGTAGNIVTTGYIAGPATLTIDPAGVGDNTGKVVIAGNLQVDGTQTTINSTTLDVDDLNITVASGAADSAAANGAGLTVDGAGANITYTHATTSWDFNKDINVTGTTTTDQYLYVNSPNGTQLQLRSEDAYTTLYAGNRNLNISANRTIFLDDAFAETMRINDDGNVGIGTSSPDAILDIEGNFETNYALKFTNTQGTGKVSGFRSHGTNGNDLTIYQDGARKQGWSSSEVKFYGTSNAEVMRIQNDGNVGIGTTSPSSALNVVGANNSTLVEFDVGTGAKFNFGANSTSAYTTSFYMDNTGLDIGHNSGTRSLNLKTDSQDRLTILGDGNVGIGTSSPQARFAISQASDLSLTNSDSQMRIEGNAYTAFFGLDATSFQIGQNSNLRSITFHGGSGMPERMRILPSGNVGIGTSAPATALHVRGTASTVGATRSVVTLTDDTAMGINVGSGVVFRGLYTSAGAEANYGGIFAGKANANSGNANGYLSLSYSASGTLTEGIRISETGYVGIGTDTPARSLEVHNGSSSMIAQFRSSSGDDAFICFANNTSTADKVRLGSKGDDLVLSTNFTPRVTIENSGKVGIGDSTPTANGLTLFSSVTGATRLNLHIGGSGTVPNSGSYNTISNNQHADILISSNAYINGNGNPVITSTHGNMGGTGIKISGANGSHDIKFYTSNAASVRGTEITNTERMTISNVGNVGIGTSTFGIFGKLQVAGGIGLTGNSEIRQSTGSDGNTLRFLGTQFVAGTANSHSYSYTDGALIAARAAAHNALLFDVGTSGTSGHKLKVLNDSSGVGGSLQYLHGSDTRFIVKSSTGNVGIGTATPSTKLDISTSGADGITLNADTVTSTASNRLFFNNGTAGKAVGLYNSFNALRFTVLATPGTSTGTEKMRLTEAGFLSLGGHAPATILDIANVGGAHGLALNADANNATLSSRLFFNNGTAGKAISIMNNGNDLSISTAATPGSGSGSEKVRILENGNVGIGTTSPSQKLDVAGNIALSGTVDGVDIAARDGILTSTTTTANAALPKAGGTITGDVSFTNGNKAVFGGTGNGELEIYAHATNNNVYISENGGSGNLNLGADNFNIYTNAFTKQVASFTAGSAKLLNDGNEKLATTATGIDVTGNITVSGYIAGPAVLTIDPAGVGDNTGKVVIAGDLQIDGTTTTINSTTLTVDDLNITLASGAADSAAANGAGITVDGANATITYDGTNDEWDFNKDVNVTGNIALSGTVDGVDIAARDAILTSTTTTAGAALPKSGGTVTGTIEHTYGGVAWQHGEGNWRPVSRKLYSEAGSVGTTGSNITDVYGEADLSAIDSNATFAYAAAWEAVETHGARLPTLSELLDGVGMGSGQSYDSEYLWTCTPAGPHHVWVAPGAHTDSKSPKIVDITDAAEVYRTRGFFDVSRDNRVSTYSSDGHLRDGNDRVFHDGYHPNADTLTTARSIALTGAVTGTANFDGSVGISIATTATADPTLTLAGDATGSATFTNLGNATLTVAIADDSHNHTLANIDQVTINNTNDLDTYNTRGLYNWSSSNPANSPYAYGSMLVLPDGSQSQQLLQTYGGTANTVSLYGRRKTSGTWDTTWTQYFSDHYHPNADTLTTARNINGVAFDGSIDITVADATKLPLAGGTLTGGLTGTSGTFSGTVDVNQLNLRDMGDYITFYGNGTTNHSISSRNNAGTAADDLRINSYGALYINLDSNINNSGGADFVIGRHGEAAGTISNLFTVSGETGDVTVTGDLAISNATPVLSINDTNNGSGGGFIGHIEFNNTSGESFRIGDWSAVDETSTGGPDVLRLRNSNGTRTVFEWGQAGTTAGSLYAYNQRVFADDYHPNADTLTTARNINGVAFDGSDNITVADATKLPLAGGTMTGGLTINENGDSLHLRNTTNGGSVGVSFSSNVPASQIGHLRFSHSDTVTYGSGAAFVLGSTEATTTILADGKLMFDEGIYSKPATGTGAGTRKDANWDTAYTTANTANTTANAALPKAGGTMTGPLIVDTDNNANGGLRLLVNQTNPDQDFYFAQEILSTLSGATVTTADREQGGIWIDLNSTATGGDTSHEHRVYGAYLDVDSTGDADMVYGVFADATVTPSTGANSQVTGGYFKAEDNGGAGTVASVFGVQGLAQSDNATSDTNTLIGGYFKTTNIADTGNVTTASAVYGEIEIAAGTGDHYGTSHVFQAQYDNNDTVAQTNTTYLYYGNYAGVLPTTAYGVYIADAVTSYFGGTIRSAGDVVAYYSDERLKDFHGTIPNAMDKVKQLNGYYFTENQLAKDLGYNNDSTQVGVSAQEVEAVLPEIVKEAAINTEKGTDYKTVQYEKLTALLIEAVKEQQTEIDELKKLVKDLMSR